MNRGTRLILPLLLGLAILSPSLAAINLDPQDPLVIQAADGALVNGENGDRIFHFLSTTPSGTDGRAFTLPLEPLRGRQVVLKADVKASQLGSRANPWNGIKLMLKIERPGGTLWPQLPFGLEGFDWQSRDGRLFVPSDATAVTLILGLEQVSGELWLRNISLTPMPLLAAVPPAPAQQAIFTGHASAGLRGAMVSPQTLKRSDFDVLTLGWGANLVRWQLIRSRLDAKDFPSYDRWLEDRLKELDQGLIWAAENGTRVVVDLHSPPGGGDSAGGYQDASGPLFRDPAAQDKFIEVWQKIAQRYRGNGTIWGFDLANEPMDNGTASSCLDWNGLALRAGQAIRAIDPDRTLIVEPAEVGSAEGFDLLRPLPLPRVVYSFHMYIPGTFTHQGVFGPSAPVSYPGPIQGVLWNREALARALEPAIRFARNYRVQMYVGEFGAIRWAPGAERYLADLISLFEEQGWAWSFHAFREWQGWSPEYDNDRRNEKPAAAETDRLFLFKRAFLKNRQAD